MQPSIVVDCLSFIPKLNLVTRKRPMYSTISRTYPTMMPEGPEVRTLVDHLQPAIGKRLINFKILSGRYEKVSPRGYAEFWNTMTPMHLPDKSVDIIKQVSCKGKFMYFILDDIRQREILDDDFLRSIWITLGMTGYFINDTVRENPNMRWYMEFLDSVQKSDGRIKNGLSSRRIYFQDPRSFGTIRFSLSRKELSEKLSSLGPDFLGDTFPEKLFLNILSSKRPELNICKFLMDQSVRK